MALRLTTLGEPLTDAHTFRQTQTAYTAVVYHREGINLLQSPLPTLGPPWVIPFEFPLFQGIAAAVMDLGVPPDFALRLTSFVFFCVAAFVLWHIVKREVTRRAAWLTTIAFAFAPLGMLWSRSSTIETLAVSAALAAVSLLLIWDQRGGTRFLIVAAGLACLAALVKLPTALIWLGPSALFLRHRRLGLLPLVLTLTCGVLWTAYADGIKAATSSTAALTSSSVREILFGSLAQRLDWETWVVVGARAAALFALVALVQPRSTFQHRIGRWALVTLAAGPILFTNLYVIHDYYWMAVAPAAAILAGLALDQIAATRDRFLLGLRLVATLLCVGLGFAAYPQFTRMFHATDEGDTLRLAAEVRSQSSPDDLVAIEGRDWSPAILYYADRRGFTVWPGAPIAPPGYLLFRCPAEWETGDCRLVGLTH
jgi:hypothetical protein